ncbi:Rep [Bat associated cyclovirus 11]|uniref:Replication-associated protein n=1 Tax=Bat associated cyclovirus 11 TaxID=1987736 RepID=A0A0D3MDD4_9CIRC|nr:Rep [Bat associated cyclovirus 11]AIF76254.1 Rep [Bat associated cyclovirus 11]
MTSRNPSLRRFCFTWNNYTEDDIWTVQTFITTQCKYGIFGKELAPDTNTPHLQGFCNLVKPMRFSAIKELLSHRIHIEKANGSDIQNQAYCSKAGEVFESGTPSSRGQRTDLNAVLDDIRGGETSLARLATAHPCTYIRYFRGIENYLKLVHPILPRDFPTVVNYFYGPPGSGKSKRALEEAQEKSPCSIYYKPRGLWWDGYRQQDCVIIDDFYGWIKYDEMLKIMDRYPYKVQIKGGFEEFTTKFIWITSNVDTDKLYKFEGYNPEAFNRRLTTHVRFVFPEEPTSAGP